jgi:hypothetical protein
MLLKGSFVAFQNSDSERALHQATLKISELQDRIYELEHKAIQSKRKLVSVRLYRIVNTICFVDGMHLSMNFHLTVFFPM